MVGGRYSDVKGRLRAAFGLLMSYGAALVSMSTLFFFFFLKKGDPYEYEPIVVEPHNLLTVHYITIRTLAENMQQI